MYVCMYEWSQVHFRTFFCQSHFTHRCNESVLYFVAQMLVRLVDGFASHIIDQGFSIFEVKLYGFAPHIISCEPPGYNVIDLSLTGLERKLVNVWVN